MSGEALLVSVLFCALSLTALASEQPGVVTDDSIKTIPAVSRPAYLASYRDPIFGTEVTRITGDPGSPLADSAMKTWGSIARHAYSKIAAWNADESLLVIANEKSPSGNEAVFLDGQTYRSLFTRPIRGEKRWHPTRPEWMICTEGNDLVWWNPREDRRDVLAQFPGYTRLSIGPGEGNLSWDGRWIVVTATAPSGRRVAFVFDCERRQKYPDLDVDGIRLDWASISPLGNYIVVDADAFTELEDNAQVYDREGRKVGALWAEYGRPSHYDLTVDENGDEVAVGVSKSRPDNGRVIKRRLRDGEITVLTAAGYASHTSTRNIRRPGWAYVTYHTRAESWPPYHDEVVAVKLDGSLQVERFAHLHTLIKDYLTEPHGVPSPDGRRVLWASNWENPAARPVGAYVADARTLIAPAFVIDVSPVVVPRGGESAVRVRLAAKPAAPCEVRVHRASGSAGIRVLAEDALTFTPADWETWKTVRIASVRDAELLNHAALLRVSAAGLADFDLFAIETDGR
jgi:hypothetical protein